MRKLGGNSMWSTGRTKLNKIRLRENNFNKNSLAVGKSIISTHSYGRVDIPLNHFDPPLQ